MKKIKKVYIQSYFGGIYTLNIINRNQIGFHNVVPHTDETLQL